MRNPLQDEDAAFRLVLGALAYFGLIVVAAWIAPWFGFAVFVLASIGAGLLVRGRSREPVLSAGTETLLAAVEDTRRILVVANDTLGGVRLRDALRLLADASHEDVLLACPVPPGTAADAAEASAERLQRAVEALRQDGVNARGAIFASEPPAALAEALRTFQPDEVVISTSSEAAAWLDDGVLETVRARFGGTVTHLTDDGS